MKSTYYKSVFKITCWSLPFISLGFASTVKLTLVSESLTLMSIVYYTILYGTRQNVSYSYKLQVRPIAVDMFGYLYLLTVSIKAGSLY